MENQIYRLNFDGCETTDLIEFYVCKTNDVTPYKETRELGIVVITDSTQYDLSLEVEEIDSLIKYLTEAKEYIKNFNEKSPIKDVSL